MLKVWLRYRLRAVTISFLSHRTRRRHLLPLGQTVMTLLPIVFLHRPSIAWPAIRASLITVAVSEAGAISPSDMIEKGRCVTVMTLHWQGFTQRSPLDLA